MRDWRNSRLEGINAKVPQGQNIEWPEKVSDERCSAEDEGQLP